MNLNLRRGKWLVLAHSNTWISFFASNLCFFTFHGKQIIKSVYIKHNLVSLMLSKVKSSSHYASLALKGIAYCACGIIRVLSVLFGAKFSSAQSLSRLWLFATPWTAARQASLSITNSQSPPKPRSIESVIPSHPLSSPSPPAPNPSQHQSFPVSQLFTSSSQSIGVSASTSVLPMNTQDWSPLKSILRWPGWISLQSKGLSRVFSNTTVQKC